MIKMKEVVPAAELHVMLHATNTLTDYNTWFIYKRPEDGTETGPRVRIRDGSRGVHPVAPGRRTVAFDPRRQWPWQIQPSAKLGAAVAVGGGCPWRS